MNVPMYQVQDAIQQAQTAGMFGGVSNVPFHTHNNIDAPRIPVANLGIIAGVVALVGGRATITDTRISASTSKQKGSVITVTAQSSTTQNTMAAQCNKGNAVIYEQSGTATFDVNYIIILNP